MTLQQALKQLEALGSEKQRAFNAKNGAGPNQYGLKMGDIRGVARKIKTDHALAMALWETGNLDARLLATLIVRPSELSAAEMERMVAGAGFTQLAEWLTSYVLKPHPEKESLRRKWMSAPTPTAPNGEVAHGDDAIDPWSARAGWSLTAERINKNDAEGLDLAGLLDRIEAEMPSAAAPTQWTMNNTLAAIGINFPRHRERALKIGEKLGVYRDYPVSKGCTSPFAPIWINEMVKRQGG